MEESASTPERRLKCDSENSCDMFAYVLFNSPQNMPWVLNPVKMVADGKETKAVSMRPSKDTPFTGQQWLVPFCPFCGASLTGEKKPKSRVWSPRS